MKTGYFVRIKRDDKWRAVDIAEMTAAELDKFSASKPVEEGWAWAKSLAIWIRDNVSEGAQS